MPRTRVHSFRYGVLRIVFAWDSLNTAHVKADQNRYEVRICDGSFELK